MPDLNIDLTFKCSNNYAVFVLYVSILDYLFAIYTPSESGPEHSFFIYFCHYESLQTEGGVCVLVQSTLGQTIS